MKNGDIYLDKNGQEWIWMNGAYFDNTPVEGTFNELLKKNIGSVAGIVKILGDSDYKIKKEEMKKRHQKEINDSEEYNNWREKYFEEMGL